MNFENIQCNPVTCRQSSIKCATACKRKYFLKYILGVVLRGGEVKESAELGKIYHKFQQLGPGRENDVLNWVRDKQKALMAKADAGEDLDGSMVRLANLMTDMYYKAAAMAHIFWERYPQPNQQILETIGLEIKVSIPGNKTPIGLPIEGTIDKLLHQIENDVYWIRDNKSTGMKSLSIIFGGLGWSVQGRIYRLLAVEYLKEKGLIKRDQQVRGFIMDGILKPGIKQCKTDVKNAKLWNCDVKGAYLRRVKEWYIEQGEAVILSKGMFYNEPLYPQELMESLVMMKDLSERPVHPDNFPRDITRMACFQYNRQCEYHDLCESDYSQWDQLFETKYKITEKTEIKEDEII